MSIKNTVDARSDALPSHPERADRAASDHVVQNLGLVRRFVDALFTDPSITDDIPEGASVVLLPEDDSELADAHRRWGEAMEDAGKTVRFIALPPEQPTE